MSRTRAAAGAPGLTASLVASLRSPSFWLYSSWLEIVTRYRRSSIGVLWLSR